MAACGYKGGRKNESYFGVVVNKSPEGATTNERREEV
jgi:hypothetical protein